MDVRSARHISDTLNAVNKKLTKEFEDVEEVTGEEDDRLEALLMNIDESFMLSTEELVLLRAEELFHETDENQPFEVFEKIAREEVAEMYE